jgi:hypothetical protein
VVLFEEGLGKPLPFFGCKNLKAKPLGEWYNLFWNRSAPYFSVCFPSNLSQAVGGVVVPFIVDALLHKHGQRTTFLSLVSECNYA